jgi:teichuronic acid biosynthesis glycosyltransferase TuaH
LEVDVRFKLSLRNGALVSQPRPSRCRPFVCLPFGLLKWSILRALDWIIVHMYFRLLDLCRNYDVVVVTHPLLVPYVSGLTKIIYDVHDDNEHFYEEGSFLRTYIARKNQEALAVADAVVFSAGCLHGRYSSQITCARVIRNGQNISGASYEVAGRPTRNNMRLKLVYFGTVSKWFDRELVLQSLGQLCDIEYHVIGPADISLPVHDRIRYYGKMTHKAMIAASREADAFVMPFQITPLIEGVDPVKLYEYVALSKPIVAPYYAEIDRFSRFVRFYHTSEEYVDHLRDLCAGARDTSGAEERARFLKDNSWASRAQAYARLIKSVVER